MCILPRGHNLAMIAIICWLPATQIGESGWAPPLPLESSDGSNQPDDVNTKPVLLRARIPEWGTVHEVVARVEMAGSGFERTMVCFWSTKPLNFMNFARVFMDNMHVKKPSNCVQKHPAAHN